jgi:fatty-acid peroxygenase
MEEFVLYEEVKEMLCKVASQWSGVPILENEVKEWARDLGTMYESPVSVGPIHWFGRLARNLAEKWIEELIYQLRDGKGRII